LGGWNLSTVTTMQTGQWLTPTINPTGPNSNNPSQINDQSNNDIANRTGASLRPDCVGNPYAGQSSSHFFNISAFTSTPVGAGRFGNCGLGILEGPGMIDVDAGLAKQFQFGERFHLRFEATFTNVEPHGFRAARDEHQQSEYIWSIASGAAAGICGEPNGATRAAA